MRLAVAVSMPRLEIYSRGRALIFAPESTRKVMGTSLPVVDSTVVSIWGVTTLPTSEKKVYFRGTLVMTVGSTSGFLKILVRSSEMLEAIKYAAINAVPTKLMSFRAPMTEFQAEWAG